jgi:RNA polymerase sigma-70 factor (ECF subfamily)
VELVITADTEPGLIEEARQGDRSAFGELVRRHYDNVINIVYRFCGDVQLAEDVAQETFIRAWINLPSFEPRSSLRNWLYRIAVNAALDVLRRKPEGSVEEEAAMVTDQTPGPEEALLRKEQAELLQQAMRALPEGSRSVLILREYGQLSYREIAGALDIPIGTVMSRLNYARAHLRAVLKSQLLEVENRHA